MVAAWTWVDELQEVLRELGGRAHLDEIEDRIRQAGRKPLTDAGYADRDRDKLSGRSAS
jgi:hypothetical protein